jgi:thiol-disulfide isomerase/thioredoxin
MMMKSARVVLSVFSLFTIGNTYAETKDVNHVGKALPPISVTSWIFNKPDLKNKWVLLEFAEPWCPHCQRTSGDLSKLYNNNRAWLEVVALSDDLTTASDMLDYPKYVRPNYPMGHRDPKATLLGVNGVPYGLVIDQCGVVRWQDSMAATNFLGKEVLYLEQADLDDLRKRFGSAKCENKNHLLFPMAKSK